MSKNEQAITNTIMRALEGVAKSAATAATKTPKQNKKRNRKRKGKSMIESSLTTLPPTSIGVCMPSLEPYQSRSSTGGHIVRNRELILPTISFGGNTSFNITNNVLFNPGLSTVTPWLANIAIDYTSYVVRSIIFYYIPIAGTSTQGDFVFYPAYNPSAPAPSSEIQAVNNKDCFTAPVWGIHVKRLSAASCMSGLTRKFVRQGLVAGDRTQYDFLRVYVGSNNAASGSINGSIGKLYMEYEIEFFDPVINQVSVNQPGSCYSFFNNTVDNLSSSGSYFPLNLSLVYDPFDIGPQVTLFGNNFCFQLPYGFWRCTACMTFQNAASNDNTIFQLQWGQNGTFGSFGSALSRATSTNAPYNVVLFSEVVFQVTSPAEQVIQLFGKATFSTGPCTVQPGGSVVIVPA